jgi:hypothetical protein
MKKFILPIILALFITQLILINNSSSSSLSNETIILPVKVHIIKDTNDAYTSLRSEESIQLLFFKTNKILSQANIHLYIEEILITEVSFEAIPDAINGNYLELFNNPNLDTTKINALMVQSLNGINGRSLNFINSIMIADRTSVNDYRTTAHEIGHLLDLKHVPSRESLMAQGKNGELLSEDEINTMREKAINLLPEYIS